MQVHFSCISQFEFLQFTGAIKKGKKMYSGTAENQGIFCDSDRSIT